VAGVAGGDELSWGGRRRRNHRCLWAGLAIGFDGAGKPRWRDEAVIKVMVA